MIVILHNIRSIYNVGSIFRTADAAQVEKIYLCGITPDPLDKFGKLRRQFVKVSLGAEKYVAWYRAKSAVKLIAKLKRRGYKIFAIEQSEKSLPYYRVKINSRLRVRGLNLRSGDYFVFDNPAAGRAGIQKHKINNAFVRGGAPKIAFIFGNEIGGLPAYILKRADKTLEIPMRGAMLRQVSHPRRSHQGKESLNVAVAFGIIVFHFLNCVLNCE